MKVEPAVDTDKAAFRAAYLQAITNLETIESANLDTVAKLEAAVKGMATILKKTLKVLKTGI